MHCLFRMVGLNFFLGGPYLVTQQSRGGVPLVRGWWGLNESAPSLATAHESESAHKHPVMVHIYIPKHPKRHDSY